VGVHGELGYAVLAHELLEVGPHRVGPLGKRVRVLVDHLVEDLDALVGDADLIGVGVHERPVHAHGLPRLGHRVELAADVLHRLGHEREKSLELREDRLDGHSWFLRRTTRGR
jgi:hypothetical protein